jgi:subtilisin family serine protease
MTTLTILVRGTLTLAAAAALPALVLTQVVDDRAEMVPPGTIADGSRLGAAGPIHVAVRLVDPPLAVTNGPNSHRVGGRLSPDAQRAYVARLHRAQDDVIAQLVGLGGRELGRVTKAHNAVLVAIDAARIPAVTAIAGVAGVRRIPEYRLALPETVPYVGAAALHTSGATGAGVTIAVIDSGVDYTHRNLGGPGTTSAYVAAFGTSAAASEHTTRDGLFPTAKVIEGFDFVGETWAESGDLLAPDPDPIDREGHGTHVADIAAGRSTDGTHLGVAPDATLLAVKACSSISTRCSGVALLLAMDFSLDPNGDNDISDAADVINLSLGSPYGQREDDLTEACRIVSRLGVVVVAAAGNDSDRPYVVNSPSVGPEVISVAQTQVPSAFGVPLVINAPPAIAGTYQNTALLPFAPIGAGFTNAPVVFLGRGCPADSVSPGSPADPYLTNPAGKVALIDRGACNVSLKIDRAADAGAIGVLLGLVAAGDAVSFSVAGGDTFVPSLVITQAVANLIKAQLIASQIVLSTVTAANSIPLTGSMVSSSARGPTHSYTTIKPDIGAPGASLSAEVGTGSGETAFSGTSGASPMVAGAAALLIEALPTRTPNEIKALLVNTADPNVFINPQTQPGVLAPIGRIGAGELRVDAAAGSGTAAWDAGDPASTSLAFFAPRLAATMTLSKKVAVRNYLPLARVYGISKAFRYPNDAASAAVNLTAPVNVMVPANGTATFVVSLTVNAALLPEWSLNGGSRGGDGFRLQDHEFDGYITIADATDTVRLPWHILPHKAAHVMPASTTVDLLGAPTAPLNVSNAGGATTGSSTVLSLTGTSPKLPLAVHPRPGDNFAIVDLRATGVRFVPNGAGAGLDVIQFGVTTWGERSHPNYPAEFDVYLDTNMDGIDDFVAYTAESGGVAASGQNVTALLDLATNTQVVRFFTTADLGSSNAILNVLRNDLGLDPSAQFQFTVEAGDNYFTGAITDVVGPMTYTLDMPRFTANPDAFTLAPGAAGPLAIDHHVAGDAASPSQTGLLMLHTDAKKGREADLILVVP